MPKKIKKIGKRKAPRRRTGMTEEDAAKAAELKAKRKFRKYYYRGIEVEKLLDLGTREFKELVHARARRRFRRGLSDKHKSFIRRLRKAKKSVQGTIKKPKIIKTHLRNMIVVPEMVASQIGVYNGKGYIHVEVKPDMIGYYLAEFSITYKPVGHGRPGLGSTGSAKFIPLK
ncbi:40S ribosomal protein S15 [Reticulomyxa filosa]|uniref:40S ribosomal protein S15 n=1 Tax=Reticulomyxa filosa TaxID=46433 RepID=X6LNX9_RETFI|nr:40S ribosomal protein S15 [Reticulomyxa filosa]|eukprot:ETO03324.1 40S ribosomal protein S15 [Reticulomyxa filosa]